MTTPSTSIFKSTASPALSPAVKASPARHRATDTTNPDHLASRFLGERKRARRWNLRRIWGAL